MNNQQQFGYYVVLHCNNVWGGDSIESEQYGFGPWPSRSYAQEVAEWEAQKRRSQYHSVNYRIRHIQHEPDFFHEAEHLATF